MINNMIHHDPASHLIKDWTVNLTEIRSAKGDLYDRDFSISKLDSSGRPMNEHFHSLIEAIEFAQGLDGDKSSPWIIAESMAAQAKTYYFRYENDRA